MGDKVGTGSGRSVFWTEQVMCHDISKKIEKTWMEGKEGGRCRRRDEGDVKESRVRGQLAQLEEF